MITGRPKGADYERKLVWKTGEGFNVRPYYRAENLEGIKFLGSPGRRVPLRTRYARAQPLARTPDRERRMPQGGKRRGTENPQRRRRLARLLHRVGGFLSRRPRHAAQGHLY